MGDGDDEKSGGDGGGLERAACLSKLKWCIKPGALIAFCILQAVWTVYFLAEWTEQKDDCLDLAGDSSAAKDACNDLYDDNLAAFALSLLGYLVIVVGCVLAIVINLLNCNDCCGKLDNCLMVIVMVVLLVGGAFYVTGNMYYLVHNEYEDEQIENFESPTNYRYIYFASSAFFGSEGCSFPDLVAVMDMFQMMSIAKTMLATLTVWIFAVDLWKNFMDSPFKRAVFQNGVLFVVSAMQFIAYAYFGQAPCEGVEEIHLMATGYFFIAFASILYIVFANAPMTAARTQMRVVLAMAFVMLIGAVFVGIGMWGSFPTDEDIGVPDEGDLNANDIIPGWIENKVFVTGYVVLLWALCFQSALDMGLLNVCGPVCKKE